MDERGACMRVVALHLGERRDLLGEEGQRKSIEA